MRCVVGGFHVVYEDPTVLRPLFSVSVFRDHYGNQCGRPWSYLLRPPAHITCTNLIKTRTGCPSEESWVEKCVAIVPVVSEGTLEAVVIGVGVCPNALDPLLSISTTVYSGSSSRLLLTNLLTTGSWSVMLQLVIFKPSNAPVSISNLPLVFLPN